jgi:hypothetical protein
MCGRRIFKSWEPGVRLPKDRTYGFVYDENQIVGLIKAGEFRSDMDGRLIALVKNGQFHDAKMGEALGSGVELLGLRGKPLPEPLKARFN